MESLIVRQKVGKRRRSPPSTARSLWKGDMRPPQAKAPRPRGSSPKGSLKALWKGIQALPSAFSRIPSSRSQARGRRILRELEERRISRENEHSEPPLGDQGSGAIVSRGLLSRALPMRSASERAERRILIGSIFAASLALLLGSGLVALSLVEAKLPLPRGGAAILLPAAAPDLLSSLEAGQAADQGGPESGMVDTQLPLALSLSTHVLAKGQTIDHVAKLYGLSRDSLISMNGIVNVKRIKAGTVLKIPNMNGVLHTVKKGESLSGISARYKADRISILDANDLETDLLIPGQTLFVPGARLDKLDLKRALGEQIFAWPVRGRISSNYGPRLDPFTGKKSFHKGIDIVGSWGSPIKAALDGRVEETGYSALYGNYVILSHDGGFQTSYCHLSSIGVKKGTWLSQGAVVGKMGSTGYSTGTHLHFGVYRGGTSVNPFNFLGK